jgi:GNAT superfamily N-acetyltransferase
MAAGLPYADARRLVAYDGHGHGHAVAAATVWSAGPGKPGLLEPMGVHRERRGHGYGYGYGDHPRRGGCAPGVGLVERDSLHAERQCRRRRHLRLSRLPATPEVRDRYRDA